MSEIMRQLKTDHANVARMLDLLDQQLAAVQSGTSADFELMHDIMEYMTHYPDRVHHPMEDLVFQRLQRHDEAAGAILERLAKEHRALAEKGSAFLDVLSHVVDGAMVKREELAAQGRDYVEFLRGHMAFEDEEAFPIAEGKLEHEDWQSVATTIAERTDPVFGPVVAEQFRELFERIAKESE